MRTSQTIMLIFILTVSGVQAADKKTDHLDQATHGSSGKHQIKHNSSHKTTNSHDSPQHNASSKQWTPPPGRLPDSLVASLTFDSDPRKHQQQLPVRFNQVAEVPEPGSLVLISIGLIGLFASRRRTK